jgi:dipeptidyl aminopeptidase/acylaminoacyl peptidase
MPRHDVSRFLNVRSAGGPSFSPDGRFVFFLSNVTGVAQLWQVPVEGGWPTQLTFTGDSVRGAHCSPTRYRLVYSMDSGGNERTQLYRILGTGDHGLGDGWDSEPLAADPKAIHAFGGFSSDGDQIAFSANREAPDRFDLYVQKIDGAEAKLIVKGPGGYYSAYGWSPDDKYLLVSRNESNFNQDLFLVEVATGKARCITPHEGEVQYHSAKLSHDGRSVWCASTAKGRDLPGLARIDTDTGRLVFVEEPPHEVEDVEVSPKGRWLAWVVNEGGKGVLTLRDLKANVEHTAPMPLGVVHSPTFAPDDGRLAFVFDGPRHNGDVWVWDLPNGVPAKKPRQLTHASRAGLDFERFVEPELIRYKSFDGLMIPAWFYPPAKGAHKGDGPPPVIVYPHGGPESQTRPSFNALFQYFLQAGYAVLAPNVRGSTGYGVKYMNLDNTVKRMDSVKDLAHAAHWLRDEKRGDPKRLAVFGGSYGGFMVLAQLCFHPDLWAAGIDVVGICNFVTFLEKTGAYRRAHREAEYGNLREHRKFLEEISPINHVDKIRCPLLVIHGANDPRVPVGEAEQIVAALRKRMVPVEYLRYEDEGHGLAKLKNRLDAYPKMVAFLDKHLK